MRSIARTRSGILDRDTPAALVDCRVLIQSFQLPLVDDDISTVRVFDLETIVYPPVAVIVIVVDHPDSALQFWLV